jgi:tetratricopeptide (TPR) repeat protein
VLSANAEVKLVELGSRSSSDDALLGQAYVLLHETMGPQLPSLDRGIGLLKHRLERFPHDRGARYWLASGLIARHRGDQAIELLSPLVDEAPDWHLARFRLGLAHDQLKQYDTAIEHYERLVSEAPHWLEPYPLLVRLYLFRGRAADAEQLVKQQLSYQANDEAWANLALARHLRHAPLPECLELIDRALHLNPRSTAAVLNRGYLYLAAGDTQAAESDFLKVLSWEKDNAKATAGLSAARQTK